MDLLFQFLKNEHNPINKLNSLKNNDKSKEIDEINNKWNNLYEEIKKEIIDCSSSETSDYRTIEEKLNNFQLLINFLNYGEISEYTYFTNMRRLADKAEKNLKLLKENDNLCTII